jgi:hypothetical protein
MEGSNPKEKFGLEKPQLHMNPLSALEAMAAVMVLGKKKYGLCNWRINAVNISTYVSAAERHMKALYEGQDIDPESGQPHAAHVMACMAILIDAAKFDKLIDDRPEVRLHHQNDKPFGALPIPVMTLWEATKSRTTKPRDTEPWP